MKKERMKEKIKHSPPFTSNSRSLPNGINKNKQKAGSGSPRSIYVYQSYTSCVRAPLGIPAPCLAALLTVVPTTRYLTSSKLISFDDRYVVTKGEIRTGDYAK